MSLHSHARDVERVPRSQTRFRVAIPRVNFFSQTMVTIHSLNMSSPPHSHSSRTHLVDVHTRFILMLARCNAYRALSTCINSDTVHTRPPHLITSKVSIAHRKVPHTNPTRSHCEGKFRTALEQCEGVLPAQCAPRSVRTARALRLCSAMFALVRGGSANSLGWCVTLGWCVVGVWGLLFDLPTRGVNPGSEPVEAPRTLHTGPNWGVSRRYVLP